MKRVLLVLTVTCLAFTTSAQTTWYKFSKDFINSHYPNDSAIGKLEATTVAPAKNVHAISCGGNDGELHIGIDRADVLGPGADGQPFSAPTLTVVISVWWQSRLTWRRPQKAPPTRWMARLQPLKDITVSGMKATIPGRHPQAIRITCLSFTRFGPSRGPVRTSAIPRPSIPWAAGMLSIEAMEHPNSAHYWTL